MTYDRSTPAPSAPVPRARAHRAVRRLLTMGAVLLCVSLIASRPSLADPTFHTLDSDDGLSHNTVWDVLRDSRGFLWIGTEAELHRYDGQTFESFHHEPDDPSSLSSSEVLAIYEDREGDLWFGTRDRGFNRYDVDLDRFERFPAEVPAGSPWLESLVLEFLFDRTGTLWIATSKGLYRLTPERRLLSASDEPRLPAVLESQYITGLREDARGDLWIATWDGGVVRIGTDGEVLELLNDSAASSVTSSGERTDTTTPSAGEEVSTIWGDTDGVLWIGTYAGVLHRVDPVDRNDSRTVGTTAVDISEQCSALQDSAVADDGTVWLALYGGGLCRFDPRTGDVERYRRDSTRADTLPSDRVLTVELDELGILWIGTRGGLAKLDPRASRFTAIRRTTLGIGGLRGGDVVSLTEAPDGSIWVGTGDGWLTRISPDGDELTHVLAESEELPRRSVTALFSDPDGRLWLGSGAGLFELSPDGKPLRRIEIPSGSEMIETILGDPSGDLWIGSLDRVHRYDPDLDRWGPSFETSAVYSLALDRDGRLWIGTSNGLARLDPDADALRVYRHDPDDPSSLASDAALTVATADGGTVWVGTTGAGLQRLDPSTGRFRGYGGDDGLPHPNVTGLLEARDPSTGEPTLWVATHRGLARFDPASETFRTFRRSDGLHGDVFLFGASLETSDGRLIFGGQSGITIIDPTVAEIDAAPPPIYITGLRLDGEPVRPGAGSPLDRSILTAEELTLDHRTKNVTFELSAPQFVPHGRTRFRYRLDGYDDDWIEARSSGLAHYTNLDPGEYVFRSQAAGGDDSWGTREATLRLVVEPPPWRSAWALTLYAALAVGAVVLILRVQRHELERERAVVQQLREVGRLKDQFLAKTSHELRTPLYGITGLAESLLDDEQGRPIDATRRRTLGTIVASGRRLSHLVNDILDFSQVREGRLAIQRRPVDPFAAVDVVLELTRPLVDGARVRLVNRVPRDAPRVLADENRLQQILHNLVGNAAKFTDEGRIEVGAEPGDAEHLELYVRDTGPGIAAADQERIFEAFEQLDDALTRVAPGSGLGLAVTRQLVELHGGHLEVESTLGQGSTFRFTLPLANSSSTMDRPAAIVDEPRDRADESRVPIVAPQGLPLKPDPSIEPTTVRRGDRPAHILVVDDEPVNRLVLRNVLSSAGYRLTEAANGPEALAHFEASGDSDDDDPFDLVLLDVMMPRTSGYQVCRSLRGRHTPEELPIIFLTAKAGPDDVVTGMSLGANDYLAKPIAKAELLARVRLHLKLAESHDRLGQLVQDKMAEVKVLQGLLPICSFCKKIRDDEGYWSEVEVFIDSHSEAQFSHGLCPGCCDEHFGEVLAAAQGARPTSQSTE